MAKKFDSCKHIWEFHVDAARSGSPNNKPWQAFYICSVCSNVINMQEKCALDALLLQKESNLNLERQSRTSMWANIFAAIIVVIAFLTFLFGDRVLG